MKDAYVISKPFQDAKRYLKVDNGGEGWVLQPEGATHFPTFEEALQAKDAHFPEDASCDIEVHQQSAE